MQYPSGTNSRYWGTRTHPITGETMWATHETGMCPRCGEMFTSDSGFDAHLPPVGGNTCKDPASIVRSGVRMRRHNNPAGYPVWSWESPKTSLGHWARAKEGTNDGQG
jgi:hypothetical protein